VDTVDAAWRRGVGTRPAGPRVADWAPITAAHKAIAPAVKGTAMSAFALLRSRSRPSGGTSADQGRPYTGTQDRVR